MGVHMILKDALIIGKEGEDPNKYKVSNRTGKETAYFCVGVNQYDPTYEGNYHYNNFFVSVPSDRIAMIRKLKLRRNSLVHLYCSFDYGKEITVGKDYGKSRLVNGVILTLIDIEYGGATSSKGIKEKENNEGEQLSLSSFSESENATKDVKTNIQTMPEPTTSVEETVSDVGTLEAKMNVPMKNLDEDDVFMKKIKKKRKFF